MSSDSKPIDLDEFKLAIGDLPDDPITSIRSQLINSLSKLQSTNQELDQEIHNLGSTEQDRDDIQLFRETILENDVVIQNQQERLKVLEQELIKRGLLKETQQTNDNENGIYL